MAEGSRRWKLTAADPYCGMIAADVRSAATDSQIDIGWEVRPGIGESTALAAVSRFGGRVGLVSVAPIWNIDGRPVFLAQAYAQPPVITRFAPGWNRLEAKITPILTLSADFVCVDSRSLLIAYTLHNTGHSPLQLDLQLVIFSASEGVETPTRASASSGVVTFTAGELAVSVGLAGGTVSPGNPRTIGRQVTIDPSARVTLRASCSAQLTSAQSVSEAASLYDFDLAAHLRAVGLRERAVPDIYTGDDALDAGLAFSLQQAQAAFVGPGAFLPFATITAARQLNTGADAARLGDGPNAQLALLTGSIALAADPALAKGLVHNFLAVQQSDGWIDAQSGPNGQKSGVLCAPLLARFAWSIFQIDGDETFLRAVYQPLGRFFERWLKADADGDGAPEWTNEAQAGWTLMPGFTRAAPDGPWADIQTVEPPDLLAYLHSEALSLREMAYYLRDVDGDARFSGHAERISVQLESLWQDRSYRLRDRDTHASSVGRMVLADGRADEEHFLALELDPPNRLVISVLGGADRPPTFTLRLRGRDLHGVTIDEHIDGSRFFWTHSRGVLVTAQAFRTVDSLSATGLTGVYRLRAATMDLQADIVPRLMPLWSPGLSPDRVDALLSDLKRYLRPNGLALSRQAAAGNVLPAAQQGIWPYWTTLAVEGLIEAGRFDEAADLLNRLLRVQTETLRTTKAFWQYYDGDGLAGHGERGHSGGLMPVHLLLRLLGIRIVSSQVAWVGGPFPWPHPITIHQHGVTVMRSAEGSRVTFPHGVVRTLLPGAPLTELRAESTSR